jgi:glycine cleavage system H protein
MDFPADLKYTPTHEWSSPAIDGVVTVGITHFAQDQLGDVVFVELPDTGEEFKKGDPVAVVESVKTASDIYAPMTGKVVEVNLDLDKNPEQINSDPYSSGWIFRLYVSDLHELSSLLDAATYGLTTAED